MTDRQRGAVLVTVLWLIALLSALAMAASITFRGFASVVALDRDRVQAEALLTGGIEAAVHLVEDMGDAPVAEFETTIPLVTGSVRTHLSDEGGRIDIGKAPVEVLAALFRSVGASAKAADAVALAIARRREPADPAGGAANRLRAPAGPLGAPVKKANPVLPFTDIRQLALIPGMAPEWVTAIEPLTTVYGNETVNPLSAPAHVIAALPGVDPARVQAFLQMRDNFAAVSQLASILGTEGSSHGDACEWSRPSRSSRNRANAGGCATLSYSRLGSSTLSIGGMTGRSRGFHADRSDLGALDQSTCRSAACLPRCVAGPALVDSVA
jgi:general secretion pathway protein K